MLNFRPVRPSNGYIDQNLVVGLVIIGKYHFTPHTHTYPPTHVCTHAHTHTCTHAPTHPHTHTHTHSVTHRLTHTHV